MSLQLPDGPFREDMTGLGRSRRPRPARAPWAPGHGSMTGRGRSTQGGCEQSAQLAALRRRESGAARAPGRGRAGRGGAPSCPAGVSIVLTRRSVGSGPPFGVPGLLEVVDHGGDVRRVAVHRPARSRIGRGSSGSMASRARRPAWETPNSAETSAQRHRWSITKPINSRQPTPGDLPQPVGCCSGRPWHQPIGRDSLVTSIAITQSLTEHHCMSASPLTHDPSTAASPGPLPDRVHVQVAQIGARSCTTW